MKELILNAIEQIDILVDKFVDDENNAYLCMVEVINLLNQVFSPVIDIFSGNNDAQSQAWIDNCRNEFAVLEKCIEKRDTVGIIDVLGYEIREIVEDLYKIVG